MNLYEITLHGTDSIYLLASTKYRALKLAGDYLADTAIWRMCVRTGADLPVLAVVYEI